jgi:glutamate---cysteine ligase / carboxylate-amine ligase
MTNLPAWAEWRAHPLSGQLTVGIEEEFMLLDPADWSLAFRSEEVRAGLPDDLRDRMTLETHAAVMEIATGVHHRVGDAVAELAALRGRVGCELSRRGLRPAVAGTHPSALAEETVLPSHPRYRQIGGSMRALAHREPTLATHIHVGVTDPSHAVRLLNRLRARLPLLLALSANSPFWRGRPSGFASTRTTLFDAFPRTGPPRHFDGYGDWVSSVERLLRVGAIDDPSYLWWDLRLQPRYGTVEVRIMDAQTDLEEVAALAALVQALASFELEAGDHPSPASWADDLLAENRFRAARDGVSALLIDEFTGHRVPLFQELERTLHACRPHALQLDCQGELDSGRRLVWRNGAARQLARAGPHREVHRVAAGLADAYPPLRASARAIAAAAA